MPMKKFSSLIKQISTFCFFSLLASVSSLSSAQAETSTDVASIWNKISWLWTKGHYSLQTEDGYPTATSYCLSLNNNGNALGDGYAQFEDYYFESHLMNGTNCIIIRSRDPKTGLYHYRPRPGCENEIIDYVEGWYAQQDFLNWSTLLKSAPCVSDIYSYVEAQLKLKAAEQGKALPEEERTQAEETIANLRKKFSQAMLVDLRYGFSFDVANLNPANQHLAGSTFDHLDQLINKFLQDPAHELTLVEEYLTTSANNHMPLPTQVKGHPIIKLSHNQETNCDTVTLAEGISPDDHLPFIILNSTVLPYYFSFPCEG